MVTGSPLKLAHLAIRLPSIVVRIKKLITACEAIIQQIASTESRLVAGMALEVGSVTGLIGNFPVSVARSGNIFQGAPSPTLGAMAARMRQLEAIGTATIRIEKYRGAAIVYLPGTKTGSFGWSTNPMDMKTNLQAYVGQTSNVQRGLAEALRQASVAPTTRIMLIGHSQGGLTAMAAASNHGDFPYKIEKVVTFGSPVGQKVQIGATKVLAVENSSDLIPTLDLKDNPSSPNWLTLRPKAIDNPVSIHLMDAYQQSISHLDLNAEQQNYVKQFESFAEGTAEVSFYDLIQGPVSSAQ